MSLLKVAVKTAIARKGITIIELADKMGRNRKTVYSAINGNPSLSTVEKIAEAMDMKVSELIALGE